MSRFQLIFTTSRSLAVRTIGRLQCVQGCGSEGKIRTLVRTASDPGTIFHVNVRAGTSELFIGAQDVGIFL